VFGTLNFRALAPEIQVYDTSATTLQSCQLFESWQLLPRAANVHKKNRLVLQDEAAFFRFKYFNKNQAF
jgi:hypothetical protein